MTADMCRHDDDDDEDVDGDDDDDVDAAGGVVTVDARTL